MFRLDIDYGGEFDTGDQVVEAWNREIEYHGLFCYTKGEEVQNMSKAELLKQLVEENQTRKILGLLNDCQSIEEAKGAIRALLPEAGGE